MATILAVSLNPRHTFSKLPQPSIDLLAGRGVRGDAHCGETVQHLYLKRKNAHAPNRMQVHLLQAELFEWLSTQQHTLLPGQLGENITTSGIDLLRLPLATRLHLGAEAVIELTGLRTPCKQIETFQPGLLQHVIRRGAPANRRGMAGIMAVVLQSGSICAGDGIHVELPSSAHMPMIHI